MKKINIFILIVIFMITSSFALTQNEILHYNFEENGGSIILDQSGNNHHATIIDGRWQTGASVFGVYGFDFDGGNDYIVTASNQVIPENLTISFWLDPDGTSDDVIFSLYDTTDTLEVEIDTDGGSDNLEIYYLDTNSVLQNVEIDSANFGGGNFHIVLSFDFNNDLLHYYRNNVYQGNFSIPLFSRQSSSNILRIGTDSNTNFDFDGDIDEFRMFDFIINDTQVNELFNGNIITLIDDSSDNDDHNNVTQINQTNIINTISPQNFSTTSNIVIDVTTLESASCDLYIDNTILNSYENILAFNYENELSAGNHTYFVYCEVVDGNELRFEISETYTIEVITIPSTINFNIIGTDFNLNDSSFYITSPCLETGLSYGKDFPKYRSIFNPHGAYFKEVNENGFASFTLPVGEHEFCLFHGLIDFDTHNKTNNYNIGKAYSSQSLGVFNVPNNLTTSYNIKIDEFDVYEKTNPKAWGQTWKTIITGLVLLLFGVLILLASIKVNSQIGVAIGGIMVIIALGYEINGILGLILTG